MEVLMKKTVINYIFLKDKIKKHFGTNAEFAKAIGISNQELSNKLNNKTSFTQEQMITAMNLLSLDENGVYACFFNI